MKAYTFDNKEAESVPLRITNSENNTIGGIVLAIGNALAEFQNTVTF
jgi:S1-C subfamily serine protease